MALGVNIIWNIILKFEWFWYILNNLIISILFKLGPWLAVEVPDLISRGIITNKEASGSSSVVGAASK